MLYQTIMRINTQKKILNAKENTGDLLKRIILKKQSVRVLIEKFDKKDQKNKQKRNNIKMKYVRRRRRKSRKNNNRSRSKKIYV